MSVKYSIIIPTYNRGILIRQCLDAVLNQNIDSSYEIIVVNDGSTDETAQIVGEYPQIQLITQDNAGPAAARNNGVNNAQGDIVIFIDDDCIPEQNWLAQLVAPFFLDHALAATKGAYLTKQTSLIARFVQIEYEEKYSTLEKHQSIDFIDTYSAAFKKDVFLKMGGFDTSFTTASVEDQEFSFRLANAGYKMIFVPEAKVSHRHVETLKDYCRKKYKIGFWKVLVLTKNPNKIKGDSHTPFTLKLQIALIMLLPVCLLFGLFISALIPIAFAIVFFLTELPLVSRCIQCDLMVAIPAIFYIFCRAMCLTSGLFIASVLKLIGDNRFVVESKK